MWLNAFFALSFIILKNGEAPMTIPEGELKISREAWKDSIFVLVGLAVLIAIIWSIVAL